jgi:DNA-binding NarL/FixJ family response regulator
VEVLHLLARGFSNKEILQALQITEATVKAHVRHILSKLGVQSRTQAVLIAMRLGLVTAPSS